MVSPPLTERNRHDRPEPGGLSPRLRRLSPHARVQGADEDLTASNGTSTRGFALDGRRLDSRIPIDNAQTAGLDEADEDLFGTKQLRDVGEQSVVQDLGLLCFSR